MKITILDNSITITPQILSLLNQYQSKKNLEFTVDKIYSNRQLSNIYNTDIAFICINSFSKSDLLRQFCLNNPNCKIIIVAYIPDYRYAFQFHAFDFIPLPICEQCFMQTIDDAIYYITNSGTENKIALHTDTCALNIKPSKIYYFEHNSRKIIISTAQGEFTGNYTIKELYSRLKTNLFESPHRSFLVNLRHIKNIKGFDIYLDSGAIIPIAQKRAVEFKNIYKHYLESRFEVI